MGFWDDVGKGVVDVAKAAKEAADDTAKGIQERRVQQAKEDRAKRAETAKFEAKMKELTKDIIVTTGDIRQEYEIIRPIFFQVSNKGFFSSKFDALAKKYERDLKELEQNSKSVVGEIGMRLLLGEFSVGEDNFEKAFFMATEELKRKALACGADAIIHIRQDIDLDTNGFQYFYLQMYGTAVKRK